MHDLNRKLKHLPKIDSLKDQIANGSVPAYRSYLKEISSLDLPIWSPTEHIRLLHEDCPNREDYITIERNFEHTYDWSMFDHEAEKWRAEDPVWREKVPFVTWVSKSRQINKALDTDRGEDFLDSLEGMADVYFSQNSFGNPGHYWPQVTARRFEKSRGLTGDDLTRVERYRRCEENVNHLNLFFADFDDLAKKHGLSPDQTAAFLLAVCEARDIPLPSFIMFTGRGIAAIWLFKHVEAGCAWRTKELRRWKLTMEQIQAHFEDMSPDSAVVDAPRVLRPSGTINSKSGETVRPIWINTNEDGKPYKYDFDDLCDRMLEKPRVIYMAEKRAEYKARGREFERVNAKRAKRKVEQQGRASETATIIPFKIKLGRSSFAITVLDDLAKVHEGRWNGGHIPAGYRNKFLIIWVSAFSRLAKADKERGMSAAEVVEEEAIRKGVEIGLTAKVSKQYMKTAVRRTAQQQVLDIAVQNGENVDRVKAQLSYYKEEENYETIIYSYKAAKMVALLEISEREMRDLDLRALINDGTRAERHRERMAESRGQTTPSRSLAQKTQERLVLAEKIYVAREGGMSVRKAAVEFACSTTTIQSLTKLHREILENPIQKKVQTSVSSSVSLCAGKDNSSPATEDEQDRNQLDSINNSLDSSENITLESIEEEQKEDFSKDNKIIRLKPPFRRRVFKSEDKSEINGGGDERTAPEERALRDVLPASAGSSRPTPENQNKNPNKKLASISEYIEKKNAIAAENKRMREQETKEEEAIRHAEISEIFFKVFGTG